IASGPVPFTSLFGRGELLLLAVVLSAGAFGELVASGQVFGKDAVVPAKDAIVPVGATLAVIVVAAFWYGDVISGLLSAASSGKLPPHPLLNAVGSWVMLGGSVFSAVRCLQVAGG